MNGLKNKKGAETKIDGQGILREIQNITSGGLCEDTKKEKSA